MTERRGFRGRRAGDIGFRGRRAGDIRLRVLPAVTLGLAVGASYLNWLDASSRGVEAARAESVRAAAESTVAMLTYRPSTAEKDLTAALDRLTGNFKDYYSSLIQDVVIPGAKRKQISSVATVPATASVSASERHGVVLVFVDQIITVGTDPPSNTASNVRVTLDKIGGRWLISQFEPV